MAAKVSEEMKKARKLVEAGKSAYAAAKEAGITKEAIYQAKWYKDRKNANQTGKA